MRACEEAFLISSTVLPVLSESQPTIVQRQKSNDIMAATATSKMEGKESTKPNVRATIPPQKTLFVRCIEAHQHIAI